MTAREHITRAARKINLMGVGQTLGGEYVVEMFEELNAMMRELRVKMVLSADWNMTPLTLTAGVSDYLIGPFASIVSPAYFTTTARPMAIDRAFHKAVGSDRTTPVDVITREEFGRIADLTVTSARPRTLIYERGDGPRGIIRIQPIPTTASTLIIEERNALAEFTTLNTDLTFTEGSELAIQLGLAIRYAPTVPRAISPELKDQHRDAMLLWERATFKGEDADVRRTNPWQHSSTRGVRRNSIREGL